MENNIVQQMVLGTEDNSGSNTIAGMPIVEETVQTNMNARPKTYDYQGAINAGVPLEDIINYNKDKYPEMDADEVLSFAEGDQEILLDLVEQFRNKELVDVDSYEKGEKTIRQMQEDFRRRLAEQNTGIVSEPTDTASQRFNDFSNAVKASLLGMKQAAMDLHILLGTDHLFSEDGEGWDEAAAFNMKQIENLNSIIKDQDFFSVATLGSILPSLVTLPLTYQSKIIAALAEGSLAYSEARGSNMEKGQALAVGATAGGATAGFMKIIDMWSKRGLSKSLVDAATKGDMEKVDSMLADIETGKSMGLGDAMVEGERGIPSNIYEQQHMAEHTLPKIQEDLKAAVEGIAGSSKEAAKTIKEGAKSLKAANKETTKDLYSAVKGLASDEQKFDYNELRDRIMNAVKDTGVADTVRSVVKESMRYHSKYLDDASTKLLEEVTAIEKNVKKLKVKLAGEVPGSAEATALRNKIINSEAAIAAKKAELPNIDTLSEKEIIRLRDAISHKKNIAGGAISTNDKKQQMALGKVLEELDKYIDENVLPSNPTFSKLYKQARAAAKKDFDEFGYGNRGSKDLPELGKILTEGDTSKLADSILNSEFKMNKVTEMLKFHAPGTGRQLAKAIIGKALKGTKNVKGSFEKDFGYDINSLANNLSKVFDNPDTVKFLKNNLDEAEFTKLKSIHSITKSMDNVIKALPEGGPLSKGIGGYIAGGDGVINKVGRTLKLVKDSITAIKGNTLGFEPTEKATLRLIKLLEKRKHELTPGSPGPIGRLIKGISRSIQNKNNVEAVLKDIKTQGFDKEKTAARIHDYLINGGELNYNELARRAKIPVPKAKEILENMGLGRHFDVIEVIQDGPDIINRINYEGREVQLKLNREGNIVVDTNGFSVGSGVGAKFYNELWDYMDKTGMKYSTNLSSLSEVNTHRLGVNMVDRLRTKPKTKAFDIAEVDKVVSKSVSDINIALKQIDIDKPLIELSESELQKAGKEFGDNHNMMLPYRSLKQIQRYTKLMKSRRAR